MKKSFKFSEKVQIDNKDIEIIKILEKDGRIPILELAKKVKLSHETVRYRLNKLIKKGVIEKFMVTIDHRKLGYNITAIIMMSLWNYGKEDWQGFLDYLMKNNNVIAVTKVTGDYDLKIAIMAKDTEHFDILAQEIKVKYSNMIKDWQTFIFTKEYKWREIPF